MTRPWLPVCKLWLSCLPVRGYGSFLLSFLFLDGSSLQRVVCTGKVRELSTPENLRVYCSESISKRKARGLREGRRAGDILGGGCQVKLLRVLSQGSFHPFSLLLLEKWVEILPEKGGKIKDNPDQGNSEHKGMEPERAGRAKKHSPPCPTTASPGTCPHRPFTHLPL